MLIVFEVNFTELSIHPAGSGSQERMGALEFWKHMIVKNLFHIGSEVFIVENFILNTSNNEKHCFFDFPVRCLTALYFSTVFIHVFVSEL